MTSISVGGEVPTSVADVVAVARGGAQIALAPPVFARIAAARDVVLRLADGDQPWYGVNSALCANTGAQSLHVRSASAPPTIAHPCARC